jgi:predicted GNAT family acetyltransferase
MAGIVRGGRNFGSIGFVYKPVEFRGRGYAGSVTAAAADQIFAQGKSIACLYTDLRNPASNRCYARVGFEEVCESWFFQREMPA